MLIKEIRDLSRHQDTDYAPAVNMLVDKLSDYLKDETEFTKGTNYIHFRYENPKRRATEKEIQFRGKRVLVVSPPYNSYQVLANLDHHAEDVTEDDIDYIIERILNTNYFPKTFLKK